MKRRRLLRITTVPISLVTLLKGQPEFFRENGFDVLTVSATGKEIEQLKEVDIPHKKVLFTRKLTPFWDVLALVQLIAIILRFQPDIVHTHTPKAGLLGMIAAKICLVPVRMHTVAGLPLMETKGWLHRLLIVTERVTYSCAKTVYPNSKGLRDFIVSNFDVSCSKLRMIANGSTNGIDVNRYRRSRELEKQAELFREANRISPDETIFVFVGRIVRDKGIVELVAAFIKISKQLPSRLLLVGDFEKELDPLPPDTMRLLNNPKVIMAGFQKDVRPWICAADIFVFPSYREGFPNVLLQSACLEVPIIASNIIGCKDIVKNGETGLLVAAKSETQLERAMTYLASNKQIRTEMAQRLRLEVKSRFDQRHVWQELLKEYNALINALE